MSVWSLQVTLGHLPNSQVLEMRFQIETRDRPPVRNLRSRIEFRWVVVVLVVLQATAIVLVREKGEEDRRTDTEVY